MVASKWEWGTGFMLRTFGWRACASCLVSTLLVVVVFRKQLSVVEADKSEHQKIPGWLTGLHVLFLGLVVVFSHHPDIFFGIFMVFLGLVTATKEYQEPLKLKEGLLVGFFLAGLVTMGSLQEYWVKPLITSLQDAQLYFGATALTAITDNAALTSLGALVPLDQLTPMLQYALVAGAVSGGGLTVIANAPNPAGAGILSSAKSFEGTGISPVGLLVGAMPPTIIAVIFLWFLK
jgi:Na+/H+ antiporter NhaD/arsenite permease-like protein